MQKIESQVIALLAQRKGWIPDIVNQTKTSRIRVRNVVARMVANGTVVITQQGYVLKTK
jgi:hypothetical protein